MTFILYCLVSLSKFGRITSADPLFGTFATNSLNVYPSSVVYKIFTDWQFICDTLSVSETFHLIFIFLLATDQVTLSQTNSEGVVMMFPFCSRR